MQIINFVLKKTCMETFDMRINSQVLQKCNGFQNDDVFNTVWNSISQQKWTIKDTTRCFMAQNYNGLPQIPPFLLNLVLNIIKFGCALKHSENTANSFFETGF